VRWTWVAFDEAIKDCTGGNPKVLVSDYQTVGALPVIDQGQKLVSGFVTDATLRCTAPLPCILFGDHTKIFKYADQPFALGADGVKVLVPTSALDARFAFHYLRTLPFPSDTGYSRHFKYLRRSTIPLPLIEEQKRIAAILDKTDDIRRKREQAIKLADEFLRSLFLDMFGDPTRNPKEWPLAMFADILELPLRNGISPSTDGTYSARVLTLSAITGGSFNPLASKLALFIEPTRPEKLVDPRDFLICRGNGNLTLVGKGKFPTHLVDTAFPDTVIAARIGRSCEQHYLQSLWDTQCVRKQIEQGARTTNGTFKVNQQMLEKIELPLPPLRLQQKFERIAGTLAHLKSRLDCSATLESTLRSALARRAFRGEL
jgi:type I restriction enzyme S subunit